ncbi:bifunctional DNA-formamidopyrimidine glycosylase/DNA-(apurinic or apyrimidinic site) lyase [Arenicella xantha]|uniref:Formamidopyrimidine-DNA glycosylase n=1 Tax=Arenicella xantha TaxID=644221 RepID=A0A395JSJ2_9GAMM|nr:bifunctional DNA-formamidopyrimidine glycosylase/DNA-(apurinic or apyrimidinic site) lyase [Arenicella xantha]RBP53436.1 DNA-(apurinic or apyrimidinic site) lyase [Arenicella xantha]
MPELPEVETTLRGIESYVANQRLCKVIVRNASLRWPVPVDELESLVGQLVTRVERRAKYILLHTEKGSVMLHLGMSGSLRVVKPDLPPAKHDHIDLVFSSHTIRFNDPRRFGCCLVLQQPIEDHKLIQNLGPEPLTDAFDGDYLFNRSRGKQVAVKNFIMDGNVVVGVGNIYASESLFEAGIRPTIAAQRVSRKRYQLLAQEIKTVLAKAIKAGGTTLNDFTQADGKPGYFRHELQVYGRAGEPCSKCDSAIVSKVIGQRNTFYCRVCQRG